MIESWQPRHARPVGLTDVHALHPGWVRHLGASEGDSILIDLEAERSPPHLLGRAKCCPEAGEGIEDKITRHRVGINEGGDQFGGEAEVVGELGGPIRSRKLTAEMKKPGLCRQHIVVRHVPNGSAADALLVAAEPGRSPQNAYEPGQ